MLASDLISDIIPPLRTSDSVQKAYDRMSEFRVNHLPLVNDIQFLGLLSDEDMIEVADYSDPIGGLSLSLMNAFVYQGQHIYDVLRIFYERRITVIPVLDVNQAYLGMISINSMTEHLATITAVSNPGGIIILEINNRDNSLAHIAQIVESDNGQVLSSYVRTYPDSTKMEVTIKINKTDISQIIASFLRYDYVIKATFNHTDIDKGPMDRFDSLMNYLSF